MIIKKISLFFATISLMFKRILPYFTLLFLVLGSTLILWLPFLLRMDSWFGLPIENSSFDYVSGSYDGPLYVIPAKTLYDINKIDIPGKGLIISLPLGAKYFAAHLPLYPLLIRAVREAGVIRGLGYLKSMVFVNIFFTVLLAWFFYFFVKRLRLTKNPLLLTGVFLFLPRFLVVRGVGAPESLFILLILLSLYFFEKEKYWLAGLFGGLAAMTKTPGLLLFFAYAATVGEKYLKTKEINWQWLFIFFIPLGLLGVFGLYWRQMGDFFAYFHSGDNIHLVAPFSVFNFQAAWVGTAWLEEIIFYFFIYLLTVFSLKAVKYRSFFYFSLLFFMATIFIQHRDIARYALPLWPLATVAFEKFFTSKKFLTVLIILLPAIYLYAWNFLLYNVTPIGDWKPFL